MKKFLTMLLALSVVFTYTVGTAFAVPSAELDYDQILKDLEIAKNVTVAGLKDEAKDATHTDVVVTKAVYEAVANEAYNDYVKVVATAKANKGDSDAAYYGKKIDDIIDGATKTVDNAKFADLVKGDAYRLSVMVGVLPVEKAKALAEIEKIDLTLYSDAVMDENDPFGMTYAQKAADLKADYIKQVNDIVYDKTIDANAAAVATKIAKVKAVVTDNLVKEDFYTGLDSKDVILTYSIKGLDKKDTIENNEANKEANKLAYKADVQKKAAAYYSAALTAFNASPKKDADKAAFDEKVAKKDAYVEVETTLADAGKRPGTDAFAVDAADYVGRVNDYKAKVVEADKLRVKKNLDGTLAYDAAELDKVLADMKVYYYYADYRVAAPSFDKALNTTDNFAETLKIAIAKVEAAKEKVLVDAQKEDVYYEIEKAKVVALYDGVVAKYNTAKDADQLKYYTDKYEAAAVAGVANLNDVVNGVSAAEIPTKAQVVTNIKNLSPDFLNEVKALDNYMKDVVNYGVNVYDNNYRKCTLDNSNATATENDFLAEFYAEKGARTAKEIKALRQDAMAMVAALPTIGEVAAARDEANALVKALPNKITLDSKEQVAAAYKAVEKAKELDKTYATPARLTSAMKLVEAADKAALEKMEAALPAVITAADKEAVKAFNEAVKAFDENEMYVNDYTAKKDYAKLVKDAERKAVVTAIGTLSKDSTKAEVEKVRAAYDAYVAEYTDYAKNEIAANDPELKAVIDRLLDVEALVKANEIAAVESVKVKASSKAYKGAIRVNWTVKGDKEAVDGYEVFRSVKKNSGFGTKAYFKTTKTTYKNTKALKKGTRYYYKVRAYKVVDGKKYYSDWSNKAYRIAK